MNFTDYLFEESRNVSKPFVAGVRERLEMKDLYKKVTDLAGMLNDTIGSGTHIIVMSENTTFFIISYLATIKSGNIAVVIEPTISQEDLERILKEHPLSAIFVQKRHLKRIPAGYNLIDESILSELPEDSRSVFPETAGDDPAVILYTSGSTGKKKGVMLSQKNLRSNTESIIQYLELTGEDRMYIILPFCHSFGASLLHTHLRVGGSVVLGDSIFLGSFVQEMNEYECTGFAGVPSTYQLLIKKTDFLTEELPHLRHFQQAGGGLDIKYIHQIIASYPDKKFFHMYGITEATARCSYLPLECISTKLGSIGKGIPGVKIEVLNKNDEPVIPGEVGEITIIGDNVMIGYYRDPGMTERVLKNGRLYTGDLAIVDDDGFIYFEGRNSNLIKSAGYRISPMEIEKVINSLNGVSASVVLGLPDDLLGDAIVAFVQPEKGFTSKLKDSILSACHHQLPGYKIPREILFINEFPLNSSEKVDYLRLKEMFSAEVMSDTRRSSAQR